MAGHQGGSLTHGPEFLTEHLPRPLAALARLGGGAAGPRIANADSALVYDDLVAPILAQRCTSCHGAAQAKGGLRAAHGRGAVRGGDERARGSWPASPEESDLLRRVTLPPGHDDAMPPAGARPLGVGETELLRWWIANGASTTQRVGRRRRDPLGGGDASSRGSPGRARRGDRASTRSSARPPTGARWPRFAARGSASSRWPRTCALLHVTAVNVRGAFDDERLRALLPVAAQVTWLDLSGTRVTDAGLATLARMPNLTRLSLGNTAVGDAGLRHLAGLARLENLNLYGTRVSDAGLDALRALGALRVVYLWGTRVTPEGRAALQGALPNARVFAVRAGGRAVAPSPSTPGS